ncbi:MAG: DUF1553 domain-containing protein, partial [Planctomycetota bacterium]
RVNTTGAVWLGATLGCAQCHTHKFDPITQTEYFQLFAFFNQTEDGGVSLGPTEPVVDERTAAQVAAYHAARDRAEEALALAEATAAIGFSTWLPSRYVASEGPELTLEPDGSLRCVAHNPQTSVYTLEGDAPRQLSTLRLEALPDLSLRGHGPGRSGNGNFVVSRVRLFVQDGGSADWREHGFHRAVASHEQANYPVQGALSAAKGTGWGIKPHYGTPHVAHFSLAAPLALPEGATLKVEIEQLYGANHVLGRFRLRFGREEVAPVVSSEWRDAWQARVAVEASRPRVPRTLVMKERATPRVTRLFRRGSFLDPGEVVIPGYPAAWSSLVPDAPRRNRLDLARWLVHPDHALVHRVTVNRIWQRFFGAGLVETENDFGLRGAVPTHPDLLEWLAGVWVRDGFSMKALHRRVVTSETYRRSSRIDPAHLERDPRNRSLARQARWRFEAEWIRDSALRVSGRLVAKLGGPPVQPPQPDGVFAFTQSRKRWVTSKGDNRYRRSLYTRIWRSATYPFATTFDAPVADVTCTRRARSNTPLQALALANDPMLIELADHFGDQLRARSGSDATRIGDGFTACASRAPDARELEILVGYLQSQRGAAGEDSEARAWRAVARVLFNLDAFLTRE